MKSKLKITLLLVLVSATPAFADQAIFDWVKDQLNIEQDLPIPTIHYVTREQLQDAFEGGNLNAFVRWTNEFGIEEANRIMDDYLEQLLGFFDEKSLSIYIGTFLDPCRQKAILAHEITHYFQEIIDGNIEFGTYNSDMKRFVREMEAYSIEERYEEFFCSD